MPKFAPQTYGEWHQLLQKMDPNPFIRAYHLKKADEQWHDKHTSSWGSLKKCVKNRNLDFLSGMDWDVARCADYCGIFESTDAGYVSYRSQIKQGIESAKQPTVGKTF